MAEDELEPPPDPGEAKAVFIITTHVVETHAGTFSVVAFDPSDGEELASAPLVPDAEDWADALSKFWAAAREQVLRYNSRGSN